MKNYRIVVDENMPGITKLFAGFDIVSADGRTIDPLMVQQADAIFCRSVTAINKKLLESSKIKFVGTATIGIDHLDIHWLKENHIGWSNAAGCNAAAVAQYVLSAIAFWCLKKNRTMQGLKVGIVGAGFVGTELARCLDVLGISYLLCDPPLQLKNDPRRMSALDKILACDVVSLHVPLTKEGDYPTYHMLNEKTLKQLTDQQLLINTARGAVINNKELETYFQRPNSADIVLDVYENEPNPSIYLIEQCLLATPHIAGHTLEGKLRGTWAVYKAFCDFFNVDVQHTERELYPPLNRIRFKSDILEKQLIEIYDIASDSTLLKQKNDELIAVKFDRLRKNATQLPSGIVRRDYSGWCYEGKYQLKL